MPIIIWLRGRLDSWLLCGDAPHGAEQPLPEFAPRERRDHRWVPSNVASQKGDEPAEGEVIGLGPAPSREQQRLRYILPNSICLVMVFLAYFGHAQAWLVTPIMWLGIIEGFGHGLMIPTFIKSHGYNPGKVTGLLFAVLGWFTFVFMLINGMAAWWQYVAGLLITLALLVFMQQGGMRMIGIKPTDMPKMMKARLAEIRSK